ncbi:hypothetical protein F4859DRAFT_511991 [Xylaria cf. heliscus]|nr:hypothetical protein F4859DRAFT_511991 [Xylaria cf. heliscus]
MVWPCNLSTPPVRRNASRQPLSLLLRAARACRHRRCTSYPGAWTGEERAASRPALENPATAREQPFALHLLLLLLLLLLVDCPGQFTIDQSFVVGSGGRTHRSESLADRGTSFRHMVLTALTALTPLTPMIDPTTSHRIYV